MANGEWLTQLMAGLGGAFTGATQAKERMALEAEAERKRMEQENERQRLANQRTLASNLFKGPLTQENIMKYAGETGDITGAMGASRFLPEPAKLKPTIEGVNPQGYKYSFDPNTNQTITSPVREFRAPRETGERPLTQAQLGAGLTFYNRYLESATPVEKARRQKLVSDLETQFPSLKGNRGALGYMLMGGMRGMPEEDAGDPMAALRRLSGMGLTPNP